MFQWYIDWLSSWWRAGPFPANGWIVWVVWGILALLVGSWVYVTSEEDDFEVIPGILATILFGGFLMAMLFPIVVGIVPIVGVIGVWVLCLENARKKVAVKNSLRKKLTAELALREEEIFEAKKELGQFEAMA